RRDPDLRLTDISFLPAIPDPAKIICVGLYYKSHIREGGREIPTKPVIFSRFPNIQVGDGQPIARPSGAAARGRGLRRGHASARGTHGVRALVRRQRCPRPHPPPWKQAMVVLLALYPIAFLFGYFVQRPLLLGRAGMPFWSTVFIANGVSVVLL